MLQVLPQFHVGGWNVQPLLAWWKGATVVLERGLRSGARARADRREARDLDDGRSRDIPLHGAGSRVRDGRPLVAAPRRRGRRADARGAARVWHERGVEIVQGYGLTEAAPNVLCLPPEDAARKRGFAGKPYPHVDVALRDPETGRHLDGVAEGELVVKGPNVFAGYWRNDEATSGRLRRRLAAHRRRRRSRRGGLLPDRGRPKDMVISGGENVYPAEIENVLHEHPAVAEAAVVGVPDERWGEACLAFVVLGGERPRKRCSSTAARASPATRFRAASASSSRCRATRSTRSSSPSCLRACPVKASTARGERDAPRPPAARSAEPSTSSPSSATTTRRS